MNNFFRLLPQTILEGHEVAAKNRLGTRDSLDFIFSNQSQRPNKRISAKGALFYQLPGLFVSLGHQT
ncbi:MAG: hypothetical protein CM15mP62_02260 [Rhodospirillaceae bacterium]|nr:MAG: hypothetical protein CM15mP62_02260 [Rhodospirillaceae bacterium]